MTRCPKCAHNAAGDVVLHCDDHIHEAGWRDLGYVGNAPSEPAKPLIPDSLLGPAVAHLTAESPFLRWLLREYRPQPVTQRQRWAFRVREARERVALRLAPWLDREDDW